MVHDYMRARSEPELRAALIYLLGSQGLVLAERVPCTVGEPDLVTADHSTIYEIKYQLTRKALFQGLGQLLLYRECLNPRAQAILVGYATRDTPILLPFIRALNVEVLCWEDLKETRKQVHQIEQKMHPTHHKVRLAEAMHLPSFRWNVASLALAKGYKNVPALAARMGLPRQSVYGLWKGETMQISLNAFERLCYVLDAQPGDWFVQEVSQNGFYRLDWSVAAAAVVRGLKMATLSHRADVYMRSLRPIWYGQAQAVSIDTLARLASILDSIQPFAIGDLFTWTNT